MNESIREAIREIFLRCQELTEKTGRPFSPDGHLVGSLGEIFAAEKLDLRLMKPSNKGFDAVDEKGRQVEIKATTRNAIALSGSGTQAERLVVVKFDVTGNGSIAYDGPAKQVWDAAGAQQANGQRQISLSTIRLLAEGRQEKLFGE